MWHLLALAVLSRSSANVTVDGVSYGPRQTLTCTWFTNFENSIADQPNAYSCPVIAQPAKIGNPDA